MPKSYRRIVAKLAEEVRKILDSNPGCHDWDHTLRVWRMARRLARVEGADSTVVECAALLHDVGRSVEMADRGRTCHARVAARIAPEMLRRVGIHSEAFVTRVVDCILCHRYRGGRNRKPKSLEAKVLYDADKLDSIGAMGIARAFHFAGRIGARLHNRRNEALTSESYSREDTAYREYLVKLRHVLSKMTTAEGRRLARERHRFMVRFFDRLNRESEGGI